MHVSACMSLHVSVVVCLCAFSRSVCAFASTSVYINAETPMINIEFADDGFLCNIAKWFHLITTELGPQGTVDLLAD